MRTRRLAPLFTALLLTACGSDTPAAKGGGGLDQSSPAAAAESLFAAARPGGDLGALAGLLAPSGADGDAREITSMGKMSPDSQARFRQAFATGKVSGEIKLEGDKAAVPILFGPDGTDKETLVMVKHEGKWYLQGL